MDVVIKIPMEDLIKLLEIATREGIRIGKADTDADHTESGVAYHTFHDYMNQKKDM